LNAEIASVAMDISHAVKVETPEEIVKNDGKMVCALPECAETPKMPDGTEEAIAAKVQRLEE
jgi:hypothetical protein